MTALFHIGVPDTRHQRSRGEVAAVWSDGRLQRLRQAGSARGITLPGPELVVLNTSGGLTGGDRLDIDMAVTGGGTLTATTQTAERVYRTASGAAHINVSARVESGCRLDWLPQETILFQDSAATRETRVDLFGDATLLTCETVILGRPAMGESLTRTAFRDRRQFRRDGRIVHLEVLGLDPSRLRRAAAGLADARAISTVVLLAKGAEDLVQRARDALTFGDVTAAASGWDGRLVVRLMAADGFPLRRQLIALLAALRPAPLPRVWQT